MKLHFGQSRLFAVLALLCATATGFAQAGCDESITRTSATTYDPTSRGKVAGAGIGPDALLGTFAIIGSALCYAVNIVLMRHQALAAKPLEITFFQAVIVMLLWLLTIPVMGLPAWPAGQGWWIGVASALSTAGTLIFAWAYARGEASYLAVTEYSAFLWASALGWLVFRELVSPYTIVGAVLIVGGCLVAARRKFEPPEIDLAA